MQTESNSLNKQVLFWSGLGPFVLLLTFLVAFIKLSSTWFYLPAVAIVGLPFCWLWRQWGLVVTLACLFGMAGIIYSGLPLDERFWLVGLVMAVGLGIVVSSLANEEVQALLDLLQKESKSRYENLIRLDQRLQEVQEEWYQERESSSSEIDGLKEEVNRLAKTLSTYEALVPKMEADRQTLARHRDQVLEELFHNRRQRAVVERALQDAQCEVKGLNDAYSMSQSDRERACHKRISELEASLTTSDEAFLRLQGELDEMDALKEESSCRVQELESYLEDLQRQKNRLESQNEALGDSLQLQEARLKAADERTRQLEQDVDALQAAMVEKATLPAEEKVEPVYHVDHVDLAIMQEELEDERRKASRWEAMYQQLRRQFEEKSRVLGDARAQLFHTENELLGMQRNFDDRNLSETEECLEHHLAKVLKELNDVEIQASQAEEAYQDLVASLLEELGRQRASGAGVLGADALPGGENLTSVIRNE